MKIACLQLTAVPDIQSNVERACAAIDRVCSTAQPDLVVLPEFFNTIYFSQFHDRSYLNWAEPADGATLTALRRQAARHHVNIVAPIFEIDRPGRYFDTAFLIGRTGETIGSYRKVHPAATNSLEKFYFRGGVDFPVWDLDGWRLGIAICYDTFFPESARSLAVQGAELLIFPFAGGYLPLWFELHRVRAFENLAYVVVCDKVGQESGWTFGGKSVIVDPLGQIVCAAGDQVEETIVADLDHAAVVAARQQYPMYRDRQPWAYGRLTNLD